MDLVVVAIYPYKSYPQLRSIYNSELQTIPGTADPSRGQNSTRSYLYRAFPSPDGYYK